jgi:lipopolysaccharide export system protein LptC
MTASASGWGEDAMQADRHSQLVSWLKVIFPLTALALLSTLFLLSRTIDPDTVIPFAEKEIQDRLRDQQVTGPFFSGTTADGEQISFSAESLTTPQAQTGANRAEDVEVVINLLDGAELRLVAQNAVLDIASDEAELSGGVVVTSSTGYRVTSDLLTSRLSETSLESPGPVQANTPMGTLDAGAMTVAGKTGPEANQLFFTKGVKLVYTPDSERE